MDYTIGDVSRMLGISADLLRYYEKKGVVHPRKGEKNSYRYYDVRNIDHLFECLWYKNFDFSMEEIAGLVSDCDYETLYGQLADKEDDLEARLYRQQVLLERLRTRLQDMRRGVSALGRCDMAMSPDTLYYINRRGLVYDEDPMRISLTRAWLNYMPFIRKCFEIRQEDLPGGGNRGSVCWGLSLSPEDAGGIPVFIHDAVEHLLPCNCAHSVLKAGEDGLFSPEGLRYITDYAGRKGLAVCGNAFGRLLFSVLEDGVRTGYYEVWIPVE